MEHLADIKVMLIALGFGFCLAFVLYSAPARVWLKRMEFVAILMSVISLIPLVGEFRKFKYESTLRADEGLVTQNSKYLRDWIAIRESDLCPENSQFRDANQCSLIRNNKSVLLAAADAKRAIPLDALQLTPPSKIATELTSVVQWFNRSVAMREEDMQHPYAASSYQSLYGDFSVLFSPVIVAFTLGMKLGQTAFEIGEEKRKARSSGTNTS